MKLNAWSISEIGLTRKSNQDSVGHFPELSLFVVADGMGGHADGEVASRMAVEVIHGFFNGANTMPAASSDEDSLKRAVELANGRIHERGLHSAGQPQGRSLGTTVVVLKLGLDARRAAWVHVGDSRLYRVRNGTLALLTADHTLFGQEYWNKRTIPTDLPHTNRLVQALGINEQVDVSGASDTLLSGDLFLLCSDGVSGQLEPAAIEEHLIATDNLQEAGEALIRLSLQAGGRDNASAVLVRVSED
jgi:serine/threonine protein phosphatase PrpC